MNSLYLIKQTSTGEFLKVSPRSDKSIELEINDLNQNVFMTTSRMLAEKICDPSSCYDTIEELAGYHIHAPLPRLWKLDHQEITKKIENSNSSFTTEETTVRFGDDVFSIFEIYYFDHDGER